jgi:3-deoxy-7-phosphoheptulonate synthase
MGPCSIHDTQAALDYARRLRALQQKVGNRCLLVMRAYFEKPRTTVGWKGMLHDPHLDGSNDMMMGIHNARSLLLELASLGIPVATEALSPLAIHYLDDLVSWVAIGARTTESQPHREMASGLSCAVGFKNATDGSVQVALDAIRSANAQHGFLGMTEDGHIGMLESKGNKYGHLVLRGGNGQPNYDAMNISRCEHALNEAGIMPSMIVDCSHENSGKDHIQQAVVVEEVAELIAEGHTSIKGLMLESFLEPGRQDISDNLAYGVSITDACMGWDETERVVSLLADSMR